MFIIKFLYYTEKIQIKLYFFYTKKCILKIILKNFHKSHKELYNRNNKTYVFEANNLIRYNTFIHMNTTLHCVTHCNKMCK